MRIERRSFISSLWAAIVSPAAASEIPDATSKLCVRKFLMPPYPNVVRKLYIQGEVSAQVRVLGNGTVQSVTALGGPQPLRESVEWALKQWEFVVPDHQEADLNMTFSFILEENESEACIFQVSGALPNRFEIKMNYGPHMKSNR
jgi:hypothetical protein